VKRITLETFIALAHLRHFGKVAQQLNTTHCDVPATWDKILNAPP
jgi:hypothetical protein